MWKLTVFKGGKRVSVKWIFVFVRLTYFVDFFAGDGNVSFEEFVEIVSNIGASETAHTDQDQEEQELRDAFRVCAFLSSLLSLESSIRSWNCWQGMNGVIADKKWNSCSTDNRFDYHRCSSFSMLFATKRIHGQSLFSRVEIFGTRSPWRNMKLRWRQLAFLCAYITYCLYVRSSDPLRKTNLWKNLVVDEESFEFATRICIFGFFEIFGHHRRFFEKMTWTIFVKRSIFLSIFDALIPQ